MRSVFIAFVIVFATLMATQNVVFPVSAAEDCPAGQHLEVTRRRNGEIKKTSCEGASQSKTSKSPKSSTSDAKEQPSVSSIPTVIIDGEEVVDQQVNVVFEDGVDHLAVHQQVGLFFSYTSNNAGADNVILQERGVEAIQRAIKSYRAQPGVSSAEANGIVHASRGRGGK